MNFWYFIRIGYGLCAIGGPMVGISIWNSLVLLTSIDDLDTMLSKSFSSNRESSSLASCRICASCRIIYCFELFCSGLKLDSDGIAGSSAGLFVVFKFSILVHETSLTSICLISIESYVPIMVILGTWAVSYAVLSMGDLSNFGYLWWILWSAARGIKHDGRTSLMFSW